MKLSLVVALPIAFTTAQPYTQTSLFDHRSLNEQVLFRRTSPKSTTNQSPSPPRSSQSPPDQASHNPGTTLSLSSIGNLNLGSPRASERIRSPTRSSFSDGESDSSSDGGREMPRARVKARVTGPAIVRYEADHRQPRVGTITPGERLRYTVHGNRRAAIDVTTHSGNPPGRVVMTVRGRKGAETFVDGRGGASGSITSLAPVREAPEAVPAGIRKIRFSEIGDGLPERQKFKAEMEGPGRMRSVALNPSTSTSELGTSTP